MAKFNEVLRPRPGLLVIRQTRFEPTLKTLSGLGILGIFSWFEYMTNITSHLFVEGLHWAARFVPLAFLLLILFFGLALIFSGILQLIQPVEHHFDNRNKSYLRNNKMIARFDEIEDFFIRRRTSSSGEGGGHRTWYQLYLVLRSRKPIKLMATNSADRAFELKEEMISAIGLKPGHDGEESTEKSYLSWTTPEWLKWIVLLSISLFMVSWLNGFFDLGLLPENWNFWFFGIIFAGWVLMFSADLFGKITRTTSKSDVYEIRNESQLSNKIKVISIIISVLTLAIGLYLYFSSENKKKEKPVNTNYIIGEISLLHELFSFSSEKWIEEENEYISAGISGGKYVVKLKETFGSGTFRASNPVTYCTECDLKMDTSKIRGEGLTGYGLYFGGQQVGMSFLINERGQYALREFRGDSVFYNKSGDFEFSPHINQGNGNNLLKLEYKGDHVVLFANNEQLETISINPSFRISRVGLVVDTISKSSTKKVFEVQFDNLRYFRPKK
jgi:hypothetical protein